MIPRFKPYFNLDEIRAIFNQNDDLVTEFEKQFSDRVGSKYAVSFPSGRSGLFALLKSLDISHKEVVIPSYTCIVVPSAIIASKNILRFVDISLYNYNMNIDEISSVISKEVRCMIPTHMYGYPLDIKKIRDEVGDDIYIIEDAAQAILTKDVGRFGDAAFYSFNIEKQIFTFGGGMVTTNNQEIYDKLQIFKGANFKKPSFFTELKKTFLLFHTPPVFSDILFVFICALWEIQGSLKWKIEGWSLGTSDLPIEKIYLSKESIELYTKVQAAVGLSQLNHVTSDIKKREEISTFYTKQLNNIEHIVLPPMITGSTYSHYTIRVKNRKSFEQFMYKNGVQVNKVFDYSIPHIPVFHQYVKPKERFDKAFIAGTQNVNLPTYPQLISSKHKLEHIVRAIEKYKKVNGT